MGRISRLYPKGRLRLRIPKMVQSGKKYPLYIEYNWHADSIRKSTGISVSVKEWNEKGYCGIGEIRATTDIDYKYYNHALHKRIEDIDVKIHKYYEMHQHITCDVIRSFLEDNDNALRPDEGKDFIEFAKELMEKRYEKGKIGFSTCKMVFHISISLRNTCCLNTKVHMVSIRNSFMSQILVKTYCLTSVSIDSWQKRKQQQSTRLYVRFFRRVNMLVS